MKDPKECNRLDVLDLTGDLRSSDRETWATLRILLIKKEIDLNGIALCQFCESEDGIEYGLLVAEKYVIQFQHESFNKEEFKLWRETIDPILDYADCQEEVNWTRQMLKSNEV